MYECFSPHMLYCCENMSPCSPCSCQNCVLCLYWVKAGYLSGQFKKAICSFSRCLHLHGSGVCTGTILSLYKLHTTQMKMSTRPRHAEKGKQEGVQMRIDVDTHLHPISPGERMFTHIYIHITYTHTHTSLYLTSQTRPTLTYSGHTII